MVLSDNPKGIEVIINILVFFAFYAELAMWLAIWSWVELDAKVPATGRPENWNRVVLLKYFIKWMLLLALIIMIRVLFICDII